jgi:hypothetical protein
MEEVNVVFIKGPEEAGFNISPTLVRLTIALGLNLPNTQSPFAQMPPELARLIADSFCEAQDRWLAKNNCTSPKPTTSASAAPPPVVRKTVARQNDALHPRARRACAFGQLPSQ